MARRSLPFVFVVGLALALSGCGLFSRPQRPVWRDQAENACLAEKRVVPAAWMQPAPAIDGPGICGLNHPFHATALADGTVALNARQTLGCPMVASLNEWIARSVQPVAQARFGEPVVEIKSLGSYACRSIDHKFGAHLSEHSFGNATDVGGFVLADGREINVQHAWNGPDPQARAFLREVQAGACQIFTTVLAPGSDGYHYNHIHLDLAMHGGTSRGPRRYCRPLPSPQLLPAPPRRDDLPDAPPVDEELDVSQNGLGLGPGGMQGLAMGAPPAPPIDRPLRFSQRRLTRVAPPADIRPQYAPRRGWIRPDGVYDPGG